MNRQPLPGLQLALIHYGTERGRKAATQTGRLFKAYLLRKRNEIEVCFSEPDILRERTPLGEPRLKLVLANLLIA